MKTNKEDKIIIQYTDHDTVNFVDTRNTLLGIDIAQYCYERFEYSCIVNGKAAESDKKLVGYHLATSFIDETPLDTDDTNDYYGDRILAISYLLILDADDNAVGYIKMLNNHNGFYCHGIEIYSNGEKIDSEYL